MTDTPEKMQIVLDVPADGDAYFGFAMSVKDYETVIQAARLGQTASFGRGAFFRSVLDNIAQAGNQDDPAGYNLNISHDELIALAAWCHERGERFRKVADDLARRGGSAE